MSSKPYRPLKNLLLYIIFIRKFAATKLVIMKTILLVSLTFFACLNINGQGFQPTSSLTIFSEDGKPFYLILNGERQNTNPETNIRVEDLVQPYYNAKIIFEDKSIADISKNALMLQDYNKTPQDVTYKIKADKKGKQVLRYFSSIPMTPDMPPPARMQGVSVYTFGMHVPQVSTTTRTTTTRRSDMGSNSNVGVNVNGMGVNINVNTPDYTETEITTTTSSSRRHSEYEAQQENEFVRPAGCQGYAMRPSDFQAALKSIKSSGFDETRLSTAKSILTSNCMNINQIMEVCKAMSFEEAKLDFAKYAYSYCVDGNNYFKVNSVFSFDTSKTELNEYISGQ